MPSATRGFAPGDAFQAGPPASESRRGDQGQAPGPRKRAARTRAPAVGGYYFISMDKGAGPRARQRPVLVPKARPGQCRGRNCGKKRKKKKKKKKTRNGGSGGPGLRGLAAIVTRRGPGTRGRVCARAGSRGPEAKGPKPKTRRRSVPAAPRAAANAGYPPGTPSTTAPTMFARAQVYSRHRVFFFVLARSRGPVRPARRATRQGKKRKKPISRLAGSPAASPAARHPSPPPSGAGKQQAAVAAPAAPRTARQASRERRGRTAEHVPDYYLSPIRRFRTSAGDANPKRFFPGWRRGGDGGSLKGRQVEWRVRSSGAYITPTAGRSSRGGARGQGRRNCSVRASFRAGQGRGRGGWPRFYGSGAVARVLGRTGPNRGDKPGFPLVFAGTKRSIPGGKTAMNQSDMSRHIESRTGIGGPAGGRGEARGDNGRPESRRTVGAGVGWHASAGPIYPWPGRGEGLVDCGHGFMPEVAARARRTGEGPLSRLATANRSEKGVWAGGEAGHRGFAVTTYGGLASTRCGNAETLPAQAGQGGGGTRVREPDDGKLKLH